MKNGVIITEVIVKTLLHHYESFMPTTHMSLSPLNNFLLLSYEDRESNKYFHTVYDLTDTIESEFGYKNCYIMQAIESEENLSPSFMPNSLLFYLDNKFSLIRSFDVANKFRAVIYREHELYSQFIFVIPFSKGSSSFNVQVRINGIDVFVW